MGGSKSAEGGPNPLAYLDRGGPYPLAYLDRGGPYPLADLDRGVQIRWDTGIFETPKDIDDFTICPTHRSNLGTSVGWSRGSISRCRVPKKVSGHDKGRVKSIPEADRGIGKRVPQIVGKTSGKFL